MPEAESNDLSTKQARFYFKTDPDNGCVIGPEGCHYDTEAEAMYFDQLGLCGCGEPEEVHKFLVLACGYFDRDKHGFEAPYPVSKIADLVRANPDIAAEFIGHFLDKKHLLEHGGSVYGAWLTERGKQFVEIGPHIEDDIEGAG